MISTDTFRQMALAFEGAEEKPHFELTSFRAGKIFATMDEKNNKACLMLSPVDQSVFCAYDKEVMYPVPNKWGLQGATIVELKKVRKDMCLDALTQAWLKATNGGKSGSLKRGKKSPQKPTGQRNIT